MAPRHDPHSEATLTASRPSSRGAPAWADDPAAVNAELAEMDQRDAHTAHTKRETAHVQAHKEQARRNRSAKAKATREKSSAHTAALAENSSRDKAAADAAAARTFGGRAKRAGQVADTVGSVSSGGGLRIDDASGFVLGLLAWSWLILPMLNGGPSAVRDILRAKFVNKDSNGDPLP